MTPGRYEQIAYLWGLAEKSSNGSVEGLAWQIAVERNPSGEVVQLVARGSSCVMIISQGEWHHTVCGAVDAFFSYNGEMLDRLALS